MEIEHNISEWRNLPTDINQLIQGENLILNTDYTGWSPDRIYKDILKKLGIVGSPGFTYVKPQKLTLYRVSDWFNDDKREELARLASSFNLPPDHNTSLGRANLKGKSVFYASSQPFIAFDEKEMTTNNIFWISVWELPLNKLNICEFIYDNQKGLFSIALEEFWKRVKESKSYKAPQEVYKCLQEVNRIMADFFTLSDDRKVHNDRYHISSAIAHHEFEINDRDIIVYPSVKRGKNGLNIVVRRKVAEERLKLVKVIGGVFREKNSKSSYKFDPVLIGDPENEHKLKYRKYIHSQDEEGFRSLLKIMFVKESDSN